MKKTVSLVLFSVVVCFILAGTSPAGQFKIAIMQDQAGAAAKFKPLLSYLANKGIQVSFVSADNYPAAARLFAAGQVDAMFSGSGVAGTMIIKELATPVARPVDKDGYSTYWAVVIAPKGASKFTGRADYFNDKRVMTTDLASAGEFFFRSLPGAPTSTAKILKSPSHGTALVALDKGMADYAIVKNRVWTKNKDKYPNLVQVGEDKGENPDGTLIVSNKTDQKTVAAVTDAVLAIKDDTSSEAAAVKDSLEIKGYVKTTTNDFSHTLTLLKSAGVTKTFNFTF